MAPVEKLLNDWSRNNAGADLMPYTRYGGQPGEGHAPITPIVPGWTAQEPAGNVCS